MFIFLPPPASRFWNTCFIQSIRQYLVHNKDMFIYEPNEIHSQKENQYNIIITFTREDKGLNYILSIRDDEITESTFVYTKDSRIIEVGEYYIHKHSDDYWIIHLKQFAKLLSLHFTSTRVICL